MDENVKIDCCGCCEFEFSETLLIKTHVPRSSGAEWEKKRSCIKCQAQVHETAILNNVSVTFPPLTHSEHRDSV